jgi:hypothetical protein
MTELPKTRFAMVALDASKTIGPANFTWTQPINAKGGLTGVAYSRALCDAKRIHERNKHLQRNYNITFADELRLRKGTKN